MERSKKLLMDDEFFGSGYKIQTNTSFTAKKLANDFEIEQLILPQKLSALQRFKYVLENGANIQKWCFFENIQSIVKQSKHLKQAIDIIMNTIKEHDKQLLGIMGYGFIVFLQNCKFKLTNEDTNSMIELAFKIFKYEQPSIIGDWIKLLLLIYNKGCSVLISRVQQFASQSFDFKATQYRRKIGIMLIEHFFEYSIKFRKQTIKKVLLFSQDQNKQCRLSICKIFKKLLMKQNNEDVWKVVLDYSQDNQNEVKQKSYEILIDIYKCENFQIIISLFEDKNNLPILNTLIPNFLKSFKNEIKSQNIKNMFLNIINSNIKGKGEGFSLNCITNIVALTEIYGLKFIIQISDQLMKLTKNTSQNIEVANNFIILFSSLSDQQRTLELRNIFYQTLKTHNYIFGQVAKQIVKCLAHDSQTDLDVCLKLCSKSLDFSHWNAEQIYLKALKSWKFNKLFFDRVILLISKHLTLCPQFLNQSIFDMIRHVLCTNKKKRDFLYTLKDKMANNKSWIQRRNYIQMYQYIYTHCSWQLIGQICQLPMYIFINEKVLSIKLEHCKFISSAYQYVNPVDKHIKDTLKQYLIKYSEDKNPLLIEYANTCLAQMKRIQSVTSVEQIFKRNNIFLEQQNKFQQVEDQQLKEIATHKTLVSSKPSLSTSKKVDPKKVETKKTSINIGKQIVKQFSTQLKKGTTRHSVVLRAPTIPVPVSRTVKKSTKK